MYAQYYFELNELFKGLVATQHIGDGREVWDWKPVTDYTKHCLMLKCNASAKLRCADHGFFSWL